MFPKENEYKIELDDTLEYVMADGVEIGLNGTAVFYRYKNMTDSPFAPDRITVKAIHSWRDIEVIEQKD